MDGENGKIRVVEDTKDGIHIFYSTPQQVKEMQERSLGYIYVFAGPRGSGKTLSMTYWLRSYMTAGIKVWSNYNIEFDFAWPGGEIEHFKSLPLDMDALFSFDSGLGHGVVGVDEINLWASNRRSMSVANRLINSIMQLLRKRKLTFVFTCQNFQWLDAQLRWQTDALCLCHDQHYSFPGRYEKGEQILWKWQDMSGVFTGKPFYETGRQYWKFFHGKRFWHHYDSWQEFDIQDASRPIRIRQDAKVIDYRKDAWWDSSGNKTIGEAIMEYKNYNMDTVESGEIQELLRSQGFDVKSQQLGRLMKRAGYTYKQTRKGNFYILEKRA